MIIYLSLTFLFINIGHASFLDTLKEKREKAIEKIKEEQEELEKRREEANKEEEKQNDELERKHPYDFFSSNPKKSEKVDQSNDVQ